MAYDNEAKYNKWQTDHESWLIKKNDQYAYWAGLRAKKNCELSEKQENCDNGWNEISNSDCGWFRHERECKLSEETIQSKMSPWYLENPEPKPPASVYQACSTCNAPSGSTTAPASLSLTDIQNWISSNPLLVGGGCCCCLTVCILLIIVMSSSD
jgi:hypothetical protein